MAEIFDKIMTEIEKFLSQPGTKVNTYMEMIEKSTGIKRMYIAKGVLVFLMIYMIFGYFAQLICNFVGFLYPAYVSIKALESRNKDDDTRWLTYWVVFAFFSVIEFFSDFIFSWFPFYWLAKVVFLVWCYLPLERNGSDYVYTKFIRPFFLQNNSGIDNIAKRLVKEAKDAISSKNE
ncbi:receptor expression-enhancing protein 5-like [Dermatophagoides pteronyssinus]|uniref:Receptor expression-enhancing protein n=1 Tax=Dermatophagoides pteronyssinus TaxID=6956 RepID=A0A6P6YAQ5_DERPT|nr:receptor expression-enhancing protein 5-like [Dermatophagoides pteronyssinus]